MLFSHRFGSEEGLDGDGDLDVSLSVSASISKDLGVGVVEGNKRIARGDEAVVGLDGVLRSEV